LAASCGEAGDARSRTNSVARGRYRKESGCLGGIIQRGRNLDFRRVRVMRSCNVQAVARGSSDIGDDEGEQKSQSRLPRANMRGSIRFWKCRTRRASG